VRVALLLLTACGFTGPGGGAASIDAAIADAANHDGALDAAQDAAIPPIDGNPGFCYGHDGYAVCFVAKPSGTLTFGLPVYKIDTNKKDANNCTDIASGRCIVAADAITVGGATVMTFTGPNPVVLVAVRRRARVATRAPPRAAMARAAAAARADRCAAAAATAARAALAARRAFTAVRSRRRRSCSRDAPVRRAARARIRTAAMAGAAVAASSW
jgi:hypothetical protein